MLPEVISLTELDNMSLGHADLVTPDGIGLVILLVNRGPEKICRDLKSIGKELPRPGNSLILEVISEGEVTQHLEICAVACGVAYSLKVGSTDTFLAGADSVSGRLLLTCEELLHRCHTRVDKKQGFIVIGDKREGRESDVSLALEE